MLEINLRAKPKPVPGVPLDLGCFYKLKNGMYMQTKETMAPYYVGRVKVIPPGTPNPEAVILNIQNYYWMQDSGRFGGAHQAEVDYPYHVAKRVEPEEVVQAIVNLADQHVNESAANLWAYFKAGGKLQWKRKTDAQEIWKPYHQEPNTVKPTVDMFVNHHNKYYMRRQPV